MDLDFFKMRLELVKEAATRSRWVFASSIAVAFSLVCGTFNEVFGFARDIALSIDSTNWQLTNDTVIKSLNKKLLDNWMESQSVTVPIWGFKIDSYEAPILGGAMLTIFALWLFYCMRRENHLIHAVFLEAHSTKNTDIMAYVHSGIHGTQIFMMVTDIHAPYYNVNPPPRQCERDADFKSDRLLFYEIAGARVKRFTLWLLVYLPAFAGLFCFGCEIASIWMPSPIRAGHPRLIDEIHRGHVSLLDMLWRIGATILFQWLTFSYLRGANGFAKGTVSMLKETMYWGMYAHTTKEGGGILVRQVRPSSGPAGTRIVITGTNLESTQRCIVTVDGFLLEPASVDITAVRTAA